MNKDNHRVLIVVDMLNDFCHEDGVLSKSPITEEFYAKAITDYVSEIVEGYRTTTDTIIWLQDSHSENDKEFERFPPHAVKDTWGAKIINQLRPSEAQQSQFEILIPKTRYSGFYNTILRHVLNVKRPKEITVVGVCTSICVMDTVGGLANRDYNVIVPAAGVADFNPVAHDMALARMEELYGATII